jgi:uncharacterized protein (TIGR04255 family)
MTDHIPTPHPLPKKPLVEAIFELRWGLQQVSQQESQIQGNDPGFQILLGRFYDKVRQEFPEPENLPISMVPQMMTPYVVRNRFRRTKDGWPLVQLGPGILSVNDTESYDWTTFKPMLRKVVEALLETYPQNIAPLVLSQVTLRYVDAVPLKLIDENKALLRFLKDYLHTTISIDPLLFDNATLAEAPSAIALRLNYPLEKPNGLSVIAFNSGMKQNIPSLIWENMVISKNENVPQTLLALDSWIDQAHGITDRCFFALSRGKLLESFGGNNEL